MSQSHPDAALIAACIEHVTNLLDHIVDGDDLDTASYRRTRDLITAARAQSLNGLIARATAAMIEGANSFYRQGDPGSLALLWSWRLVDDLVRMTWDEASTSNPDAALIAACAGHVAIFKAYIANESDLEAVAYQRSHDAINSARPHTLAGMVALAAAAKVERANPLHYGGGDLTAPATVWALRLAECLMRLGADAGRA
ncbi:hypothetical protein [Pseudoroseomonas cervicalis]|uniref:hypothetical protein n=1 Tax=Teichococcus cervicalis TaxID=204525 RepID=UPI0022F16282|nr:hypothetical protein [Pseudoroseomonas cervicalis]WBV44024.1 hypothetical protein PFY06_05505 [Pseudoroseomonas cervicalis]